MKKRICVLLLAFAVMGAAFAQEQQEQPEVPTVKQIERQNSAALDVFPLFKAFIATDNDAGFSDFAISASYERLIVPHFSIGGNLDFQFLRFDVTGGDDINGLYFGMSAEGRYYPVEDFEKFFLGATLGFNQLAIDGKTKSENGGFISLLVSLKMGYKLITKSGFYMEPSLAYVLSKQSAAGGRIPTPIGWQGGLRLGFSF